MNETTLSWGWCEDPSPPEARAAVAWHGVARALHARLALLPTNVQSRLHITASGNVLIVSGVAKDLPWVPGIAYAATCQDAPTLWRPTLLRPDVPADLLWRALQRLCDRQPVLLWPDPAALIPLDRQQVVTPLVLATIAERWQVAS